MTPVAPCRPLLSAPVQTILPQLPPPKVLKWRAEPVQTGWGPPRGPTPERRGCLESGQIVKPWSGQAAGPLH